MSMNIDNEPIEFKAYFPNPKPINISFLFEKFTYNDLIHLISHFLCYKVLIDDLKNHPFGILITDSIINIITDFFELYNKLERKINNIIQ